MKGLMKEIVIASFFKEIEPCIKDVYQTSNGNLNKFSLLLKTLSLFLFSFTCLWVQNIGIFCNAISSPGKIGVGENKNNNAKQSSECLRLCEQQCHRTLPF